MLRSPASSTGGSTNLTGPITSVGAATSVAAQTGTGTTFAMQASPTFTGTVTVPTLAVTGKTTTKNTSSLYSALTDAATIAVDASLGDNFKVTLGGNRTLGAPTNLSEGQSGTIQVSQDGTGSRTLAYNTCWKFAGGAPTASTAASTVDLISWVCVDASTPIIRAVFNKAFA